MSTLLTAVERAMQGHQVADDCPVPVMDDPMGKYWDQPSRHDILFDDKTALMDEKAFDALSEYSSSQPSGCYPGKMWKWDNNFNRSRHGKPLLPEEERWLLCWFGPCRSHGPSCALHCGTYTRVIAVVK